MSNHASTAATIAPSRGEPQDPLVGRSVLGRYRIVKPLAKGGMGAVYLGRTEGAAGFARPVVIKRVLPSLLADPDIAKMFVREAKILSNLHHPGIVGVLDFGKEDDAYVMVLDYVHGYDAAAWLRHVKRSGRRVPTDVALLITIRLLEALHYAHTMKRPDGTPMPIVHRDISPGNVLLDCEGHVRVLDFGIARIANQSEEASDGEDSEEFRTQETTFKGKLSYAHPSLLAREEPTPQTDVYSAAVVLFQILAGDNPFRGNTPAQTLNLVANLPLPKLRDFVPDAPAALEAVLQKGMSRELAGGYTSAAELADALRGLQQQSDTEVVAELAELLSADFHGDMPEALGLEPLEARDAAWRTSVIDLGVGQLRSTPPPPRSLSSSDAPTVVGSPLQARAGMDEPTLSADALALGEATIVSPPPGTGNRTSVFVLGAVALALVALLGVVLLSRSNTPPAEQRYLFVSKDQPTAVSAGVSPLPAAVNAPATEATGSVAGSNPDPSPPQGNEALAPITSATTVATSQGPAQPHQRQDPSKGESLGPDRPQPQLLTQRFSKHQGRIQACFAKQEEQARRTPNVQIAFDVSASGTVRSATLLPGSLSGTPLGQCLLAVARGAKFGALTEAVSFRIPVQARIE